MTLLDFLMKFDFKSFDKENNRMDTDTIRIYESPYIAEGWMEFGLEDKYEVDDYKEALEKFLNPKLLARKVSSIDTKIGYVSVRLEEEE